MSQLDPIPYSDAQLRAILERVKTIAMVGASSNWNLSLPRIGGHL
jgi:hypothetical protein